ncbi:unnamed protein product [Tenebrio molitor]|nr:unnamed protein product [Tenebrio molitor]
MKFMVFLLFAAYFVGTLACSSRCRYKLPLSPDRVWMIKNSPSLFPECVKHLEKQ